MSAKKATIDDVGRLAGVSRQTVSRVLNGHPLVSSSAKQRVTDAMSALAYRPDPVARSLATKKTFLIGVLTTSFTRYVPALTLDGAEQAFRERGYQIFVARCGVATPGEELSAPFVRNQPLEGTLIVLHGFDGQSLSLLDDLPPNSPVVTTGYGAGSKRVTAFTIANASGARKAAEYLVRRGCRRFAMITGPDRDLDALERSEGFLGGLRKSGFPAGECRELRGDWSYESGYEVMTRLLAGRPRVDGVFAQNDPTAIGAIRAIHEAGLRVPDDVAVIGFDDIPLARYVEPALTTLRNPAFELGRASAICLTDIVSGMAPERAAQAIDASLLEPELVVRESC